jgi:hypothetical protein
MGGWVEGESEVNYRTGNKITTMSQLAERFATGEHVYIRGKFVHMAWAQCMQYRTLAQHVKGGYVYEAIKNEVEV